MRSIRVIVVDDHAVVREGTRRLLEQDPGLEVEAEGGTGAEAIGLVRRYCPDVLLLDLALPDVSGIEVARRVAAESPATRVAVLSAYDDDDYVVAALEAGVAAYLLKTAPAKDVIAAIHAVADGQVVLHPAIATKLRRSLSRSEASRPRSELTEREREVLRMAADGLHNKEIANRLSLSIRTVEGHLSHILAKLGVSSRTEAVVYGLAHGWFHPADSSAHRRDRPEERE
jgi:DNA-binding NarL/FixJ family response regulator